ncbi:MAG: RNA 2',3'-cyclic phosphodiesterase [Deltaproteobacteria bacterium]|nr:RNA 2',3'-cyclic phosphodiesterase [Deltaproteobacteria bacterium]
MQHENSQGRVDSDAYNLFLGIGVSPPMRNKLAQLRPQLSRRLPGGRWHPPENFHLTLRFFGRVSAEERVAIVGRIERLAESQSPFVMGVERLGFFGTPARLRVVWAAPDHPSEGLASTSAAVRDTFPENAERPFAPHVTLARFRGRLSGAHRQACQPHLLELKRGRECGDLPAWARLGPWEQLVDTLVLFASIPTDQGVRYRPAATFPLRGASSK